MTENKDKNIVLVMEQAELAVRLIESIVGIERPNDLSAEQALRQIKLRDKDIHDRFVHGSKIAIEYFVEQAKKSTMVN